jgi:transcription initiation factor TFIID subunit TAF12
MRSRMNYNQFNNQVSMQWYQNQQAQNNPVLMQRQLQLLQQQQQLQQSQNPILPRLVQSPQIQPQILARPVRPVRPPSNPLPAMFSFCPQQSSRVFGNTPLHGLLDPQQAFFNNLNSNNTQVMQPTSWSVPVPPPDNPITQDKAITAGKKRLHSLLEELDPDHQIDQQTEETLLMFADHFINQVSYRSSKLAKHANSPFLRVKDVCLELGIK